MTAAPNDLHTELAQLAEARRQAAVGHLALAHAALGMMLETVRWQPAGESTDAAQLQHDEHYAMAAGELLAMREIQAVLAAPKPPAIPTVDRAAKLDRIGGAIVETAAAASETLSDIGATVKGLGAGDNRTLTAMLDDLESRCAAMRAAVSEAAAVANCEGSA